MNNIEITQEIKQEEARAALKLKELQAKQPENQKHLAEVNEQYLTALASGADEEGIQILQEQVAAAERTIKMTNDAIRALAKGSPKVAQLQAERSTLLFNQRKEMEQRAIEVQQSTKKLHEELLKGVVELGELSGRWLSSSQATDRIFNEMDSVQREKLGVQNSSGSNPINPIINSLLIERHQAFKQR